MAENNYRQTRCQQIRLGISADLSRLYSSIHFRIPQRYHCFALNLLQKSLLFFVFLFLYQQFFAGSTHAPVCIGFSNMVIHIGDWYFFAYLLFWAEVTSSLHTNPNPETLATQQSLWNFPAFGLAACCPDMNCSNFYFPLNLNLKDSQPSFYFCTMISCLCFSGCRQGQGVGVRVGGKNSR